MGIKVCLRYQGFIGDDRIGIHMERVSSGMYIHELRPKDILSNWLAINTPSLISYRTLTSMVSSLEILSHIEFEFEDSGEAMLFKLTWG